MDITNKTQNKKRTKILIFSEAVTLAHLIRPYQIAKSLDPSKFEVHFASAKRFEFVFDSPDIQVHWIHSKSHAKFLDIIETGKRLYQTSELIDYVAEDITLITKIKPRLIIGDFRHSLAISAVLTQTTYISMINAYWSPYCLEKTLPVPVLRSFDLTKIAGIRYLMPWVTTLFSRFQTAPLNKAREHFSLPKFENLLDGWSYGDYTLYYDIADFVAMTSLPENHSFIGHVAWEPTVKLPYWWSQINDKSQLIYVSLGSSAGKGVIFRVIDQLRKFNVPIVVSGVKPEHRPKTWPVNIYSAEFLPGSIVAEQAAVVISNGGSPTSYQAIQAATPVIGIPSNMDQLLSMHYIEKHGAGVLIRPEKISSPIFEDTINAMFRGDYTEKTNSLSQRFLSVDFQKEINKYIDAVLAETDGKN